MKKFLIFICILVIGYFVWNTAYYRLGIYIDFRPDTPVETFMKTDEDTIYMLRDGRWEAFEIRGVDMGVGIPGEWATDYAIDRETYLRWFGWIQEMGANTIRVYTILHDDFYNAFYEYNHSREEQGEEPLYLLHGVWVNDYILNSHRDGFDEEFRQTFIDDCRMLVDIVHGKKTLSLGYGLGSGSYRKDISSWLIGYILGVEWETSIVTYTNQNCEDRSQYSGTYLYTGTEASPFEALLCEVGDTMIEYESERYKQQRLIAFSNWPTTDPFSYDEVTTYYRRKFETVDVEQILATEQFLAGQFASYHVYAYFPDYLQTVDEAANYTEEEKNLHLGKLLRRRLANHIEQMEAPFVGDYLTEADYIDRQGRYNTYLAYLRALNRYHTMPVVISEYGVTTGRGMAQIDVNTGRNQGHMSEQEQGQALVECYEDIMDAGCAGSCLFSWQDEWFKRTWNTLYAVDRDNTPYWSDYQTNEQFFGILTFDPGEEKSVCYVDGDLSEWSSEDLVIASLNMELSMKYDEKFLYFLIWKEGYNSENDTLYIPIDTSPKSGSTYCSEHDVVFERACDFLMVIHGRDDSRLLVQERYEVIMSTYGEYYYARDPYLDPPDSNSTMFKPIYFPLRLEDPLPAIDLTVPRGEMYETGKLRYGNANPDSEEFDSLADFIISGDYVEVRIPWQLLNFSAPSEMLIHDDYYEHYGIENLAISEMYVGAASSDNSEYRIRMNPFELEGWGKTVTSHERLKESYYILKEYWTGDGAKVQ